MKNNNIVVLTTSLSVLIAALIFSDDRIFVAVVESSYDTTRVDYGCPGNYDKDPKGVLRIQALKSMDWAIASVADGRPNICRWDPDSTIFPAANCSDALADRMDDCKLCLYNAQYRVVDEACPHVFSGWLQLTDCFIRIATESSFCGRG